jgi:hypothetical protein
MNPRPTSPKSQLSALLSRFSPPIVAQARQCLLKLRRTFPGAYELVYDYPHSVVVAFGQSDRGYEAIAALAIEARGLRLYLDKSLPDPHGLLQGSGGKVRSVELATAAGLDRAEVTALIRAAIKHAGATFPRTGPNRLVMKSATKKKRPTKARKS